MHHITRADRPLRDGEADHFSGDVRVESIRQADGEAPILAARVSFEPGARTHWHTHPQGQLLIVTDGEGWAQSDGGPRQKLLPGDSVWFAPGERHWHGATAASPMTHLAIANAVGGSAVDWEDAVSDAEYAGD